MSKKTCSKSQLRNAKGGQTFMATNAKGNFYKPYATKRDASASRRVPVSAKRDAKGAIILKKVRGGQTSVVYVTKRIPDIRVSKVVTTKKAKKIYIDR